MQMPFTDAPPPGAAHAVAPGIRWLRMPLPFALDHINLWLIDEGRGCTLVDTGYGDAATRDLWALHARATLRNRPIMSIVVTHFHPDHVGNAAWLADRYGAAIAMTPAEHDTATAIHGQRPGHALADTAALFRSHGMSDEHARALETAGNRYRAGVPELPTAYRPLHRDETLVLGSHEWRVIIGEGHSPAHAALFSPAQRVIISGDMLLPRISTNVSVHASDPYGDPLGRFLASLTAFESLPDDTLVLPSHGLPFRGIAERVDQLRAHTRSAFAKSSMRCRRPTASRRPTSSRCCSGGRWTISSASSRSARRSLT